MVARPRLRRLPANLVGEKAVSRQQLLWAFNGHLDSATSPWRVDGQCDEHLRSEHCFDRIAKIDCADRKAVAAYQPECPSRTPTALVKSRELRR